VSGHIADTNWGGQNFVLAKNLEGPEPLSPAAVGRRTLSRFTIGHPDNSICWDRHDLDGFISVVDVHNHVRPFGGPEVELGTYISWMKNHGLLFSNLMGLGQRIMSVNDSLPPCCYYLHCSSFDYPVRPTTEADYENAEARAAEYLGKHEAEMRLALSTTFANLQTPDGAGDTLDQLRYEFPFYFTWGGEINVFKHALAANAFFQAPWLTAAKIEAGHLDGLFSRFGPGQTNGEYVRAVTLHSDIGCDRYWFRPGAGDGTYTGKQTVECYVPESDLLQATVDHQWWQATLVPFYAGFFDEANVPRPNFKKVQHVRVLDAIAGRYPHVTISWAHTGLSAELTTLHPAVHCHLLKTFFERHHNLRTDASWDLLAKSEYMNWTPDMTIDKFMAASHEDLPNDVLFDAEDVEKRREHLHAVWLQGKEQIAASVSDDLTGPNYKLVLLLDLIHRYPSRFLTGTDFVASYGEPEDYPGYDPLTGLPLHGPGCKKDPANHAFQLTDTSAMNMFLEEEAFRRVVLGQNYFEIMGLNGVYQPPPLCSGRADALYAPPPFAFSHFHMTAMLVAGIAVGLVVGFVGGKRRKALHPRLQLDVMGQATRGRPASYPAPADRGVQLQDDATYDPNPNLL